MSFGTTARCNSSIGKFRKKSIFYPQHGVCNKNLFGGVVLGTMNKMQKIATKVFIYASVAFGIIGLCIVFTASGPDTPDSALDETLIRFLFTTVFIILPSFALSVAGKYLA